jgi:septation ring formation regulator EzrA
MALEHVKRWWPGYLARRLDTMEARITNIESVLQHSVVTMGQINHNVRDIMDHLDEHRIDTETVSALAMSFRRYAADLSTHLDEAVATLEQRSTPS